MRSKFKWIFTLLVAFTMQFSFAQQKTVTGTVISDGAGLPGASVKIKNTNQGTTTDENGKYSIKAKEGDILVVSYVGKPEQNATVGAANVVNFTLASSDVKVEEVVVTAVGIKRKKDDITYNYSQVKKDELTQASAPNAVQALVGKVSGLQINTANSSVNSSTRIVINGVRSITGDNQALVVIDNVISTATVLQSLPPEIIESVNVIKGLQGSALYGEQGRNGVIIVNTKKGSSKGDKLDVNFKTVIDFQEVAYLPERQTRYGQGWFGEQIAIENGAWGAEMNGQLMPVGLPQADGSHIMAPYKGDDQNIKKFFQTGVVKQNVLTVSGGNAETGYALFSVGRLDNEFVVKGDELKRTNFLFKAGKKLNKLTIEGNVNYYHESVQNTSNTLYSELLQTATNIPVEQFENAGINHHWNVYYRNPYWTRDNVRGYGKSDVFNAQAGLTYEFNKNISAVWRGNVRTTTSEGTSYTNAFTAAEDIYNSYSNRIVISSYSTNTSLSRAIYSDLLLNFNYDLTNDLTFAGTLGHNLQDNYSKTNEVGGSNLDIIGFYNYLNVLEPSLASGLTNTWGQSRRIGLFASADFNYKGFLNLSVTGRNDWTSSLLPENYSVFYPSVGLSFIPTKAIEGLKGKVLNYAKLVASYTKTGNTNFVGAYSIDQTGVTPTGYPYGDLSAYVIRTAAVDPNIRPEIISNLDFGANFGFFNDRVTLDAQYYITKTDDLATRATSSSASGISSLLTNVGDLETKGYNFDLGITPIKNANFRWDIKANLSHYKTIVKSLADGADEVNLQSNALMGIFAVVGEEFPTIKGIGYQRDASGSVIVDAATGAPLYTDKFIKLGKATPDYVLGLTNSLSYKNLKFTAVMDYRTGHQVFSATRQQLAWSGHLIESAENGRNGGFIFPNSVVDNPATATVGDYIPNTSVVTGGSSYQSFQEFFEDDNNASNAENNVLDATALKVRELALSYTLGKKALNNTKISSIQIGINARNPFMWLAKENRFYTDPEASNTLGNAQGFSPVGNYPNVRTYGVSVNVSF